MVAQQQVASNISSATQFWMFTATDATSLYKSKRLNTEGYILTLLYIHRSPGYKWTFEPKQFCKDWGIPRSTFYKAISKLKTEGLINWEVQDKISIWRGSDLASEAGYSQDKNTSLTNETHSLTNETHSLTNETHSLTNETEVSHTRQETAESFTRQAFQNPPDINTNTNKQRINSVDALPRSTHTQQSIGYVNESIPQEVNQDVLTVKAEVVDKSSSNDDHVQIVNKPEVIRENTLSPSLFDKPEQENKLTPTELVLLQGIERDGMPETSRLVKFEYRTLITKLIGKEFVKAYRNSGCALTSLQSEHDVKYEFKNYLATISNRGERIDKFHISGAQAWVIAMEKDPLRWQELRDKVIEWQESIKSGNPNLNLATEISNSATMNNKRERRTFDFK